MKWSIVITNSRKEVLCVLDEYQEYPCDEEIKESLSVAVLEFNEKLWLMEDDFFAELLLSGKSLKWYR